MVQYVQQSEERRLRANESSLDGCARSKNSQVEDEQPESRGQLVKHAETFLAASPNESEGDGQTAHRHEKIAGHIERRFAESAANKNEFGAITESADTGWPANIMRNRVVQKFSGTSCWQPREYEAAVAHHARASRATGVVQVRQK